MRALVTLLLLTGSAVAADPCVELTVDAEKHRGRVFAKDARNCWLTGLDGAITQVALDDVTGFRKVGDFRPTSLSVLGDQLQREYGREYEIAKTRDYVVVAPRSRARAYAELLDRTYRTFQLHFRVRKFDVPSPEFPLVAIVYGKRAEFDAHCARLGVNSQGFAGFYLGESNQIVMYEVDRATAATPPRIEASTPRLVLRENDRSVHGGIGERTESLLIHEATHQLGYNCGLHARLGWNPKWTVEGLATLFEAAGVRNRAATTRMDRVNPSRYRDFLDYARSRRKPKAIVELIETDRRLQTAVSDFYAESWALTYFLVETRPREYARYMQTIAGRDPFRRYGATERMADFQKAFGSHLELLDAEFVRFLSKLD